MAVLKWLMTAIFMGAAVTENIAHVTRVASDRLATWADEWLIRHGE